MIDWQMPPEWAAHTATWMGFPTGAYDTSGITDEDAFGAWSSVANRISEHEPVNMLCHPDQISIAKRALSSAVTLHPFVIDDAWLRDSGPTFVIGDGKLAGIDWVFNGWGDHTAFDWRNDALVANHIIELVGASRVGSELVNEGGGITVNGTGDVILTKTVQLDPGRNPTRDAQWIEEEIHKRLGSTRATWFERGLWRDYQDHGTRGHVDMVAAFAPDGSVLLHRQFDTSHPDNALWDEHCSVLEAAGFKVRAMPAPRVTRDNTSWVDYSYINHYVGNGFVLVPGFADRTDEHAVEIVKDLYPDRHVESLDARVIFAMGGGIHCITQQQPAVLN